MGPNVMLNSLRKNLASPAFFQGNVRKLIKTKDFASYFESIQEGVRDAEDNETLLLLWHFLLENIFPNYPERRAQDAAMHACLLLVLERQEIKMNSSRKIDGLVSATFQLCAHLNAHPSKLEDLHAKRYELQFCAKIFAYVYLRQELVRQQVMSKVSQVTRHREWFKRPPSTISAFPNWVSCLLPVTVLITEVTTFEQALLQWLTVEPPIFVDDRQFVNQSMHEAALFDTLVGNGEFYFTFVTCLMQWHNSDTLTNDQWRLAIPNYDFLITVALRLLYESAYKRQYYDFSKPKHPTLMLTRANQDAILNLSGHLMKNSDLVYISILALFESTNMTSAKSVGNCLDRIAIWFEIPGIDLVKSIKPSPTEFHWGLAVRLLLHCEQADVLLRTLQFVYKVMTLLPWEIRHRILRKVAERHFALFLHWHHDVRLFYHRLLVHKICPYVHRAMLDSVTDTLLLRSPTFHFMVDEYSHGNGRGGILARETQVWKNFDGFIAYMCLQERKRAVEANREHRRELDFAVTRVQQLSHLHMIDEKTSKVNLDGNAELDKRPAGAVDESIVDLDTIRKTERQNLAKLSRAPPYLRHIPVEDVVYMESVAIAAFPGDPESYYPRELQVYARQSLLGYTIELQKYYDTSPDDGQGLRPPPCPSLGQEF